MDADEIQSKLSGVFAPICTPFAPNEDVDHDALRFNLARYAESGIRGYLALGSNGENRSLAEDEKLSVLDDVVRHKGRGQVVLAGAAYDGQREAERFLAAAADLGADFGLVLSPGYFRKQMTDEVLFRYFSTLADRARIPLLLYNAPGFCGITLSPGAGRTPGGPSEHRRSQGQRVERHRELPPPPGPVIPGSGGLGQLPLPGHGRWLTRRHGVARQLVPPARPAAVPLRAGP